MSFDRLRPLEGENVLVVEDNAIVAFDMAKTLRSAGAAIVGPAAALKDALDLVESEPLSCGILDISIRDQLVFPVAKVLQRRHAGIVFYTGYDDLDALRREWPSALVLSKPAPPRLIMHAVYVVCSPAGADLVSH